MACGGSSSSVPKATNGHPNFGSDQSDDSSSVDSSSSLTRTRLRRLQRMHTKRCKQFVGCDMWHQLAQKHVAKAVPAVAKQLQLGVHSLQQAERAPVFYGVERSQMRSLRLQRNKAVHPHVSVPPTDIVSKSPEMAMLPPPPPPPLCSTSPPPPMLLYDDPAVLSVMPLRDHQALGQMHAAAIAQQPGAFSWNKEAPEFAPIWEIPMESVTHDEVENYDDLGAGSDDLGSLVDHYDHHEDDYDYDFNSLVGGSIDQNFTEDLAEAELDRLLAYFDAESIFSVDQPTTGMAVLIDGMQRCDGNVLHEVPLEEQDEDFPREDLDVIEAFLTGHSSQVEILDFGEHAMQEDDVAFYEGDFFGENQIGLPTIYPSIGMYLWVVTCVLWLSLIQFGRNGGALWLRRLLYVASSFYMCISFLAAPIGLIATLALKGLAGPAGTSVANGAPRKRRRRKKQLHSTTAYEIGDPDLIEVGSQEVLEHGDFADADEVKQQLEAADAVGTCDSGCDHAESNDGLGLSESKGQFATTDYDCIDVQDTGDVFMMPKLSLRKARKHCARIQKRHFVDQMAPHVERLVAKTAKERFGFLKKSAGLVTCGVLEGEAVSRVEYLLEHFDMLHLLE